MDSTQQAYFDIINRIKPTWRILEVARMSYGPAPYREIVKWRLLTTMDWETTYTLALQNVSKQEVIISKGRLQIGVPYEHQYKIITATVLEHLEHLIFEGGIEDFILREPLAKELLPEMFKTL